MKKSILVITGLMSLALIMPVDCLRAAELVELQEVKVKLPNKTEILKQEQIKLSKCSTAYNENVQPLLENQASQIQAIRTEYSGKISLINSESNLSLNKVYNTYIENYKSYNQRLQAELTSIDIWARYALKLKSMPAGMSISRPSMAPSKYKTRAAAIAAANSELNNIKDDYKASREKIFKLKNSELTKIKKSINLRVATSNRDMIAAKQEKLVEFRDCESAVNKEVEELSELEVIK